MAPILLESIKTTGKLTKAHHATSVYKTAVKKQLNIALVPMKQVRPPFELLI